MALFASLNYFLKWEFLQCRKKPISNKNPNFADVKILSQVGLHNPGDATLIHEGVLQFYIFHFQKNKN
jgi:hypothetical protein